MTSEVEEEVRHLTGGLSEPIVIQELLERLRELEAENSSLAQANETQRETYERCLDEVANHVVQALLNQKDLREECIKLKKRVFDLERQNRALSELFHQKLQRSSGSSPELHPLQVLSDPQGGDLDRLSGSLHFGQCALQREDKHRPSRVPSSCRSLDAMSPFLRKKAQILEVLRRLEATGSQSGSSSSCTASSMILGGLSSTGGNGLRVGSEQNFDYLNGDGLTSQELGGDEPWASCLLLAQNSWDELFKWKPIQREPPAGSPGEGGGEHLGLVSGEDTRQLARQAEGSSSSSDDDIGEPPPPQSEIRQRLPLTDLTKGLGPCLCSRGAGDKRGPAEGHTELTGLSRGHIGHLHSLTCYSRSLRDLVETQHVTGSTPATTERADSVSRSPAKQLTTETLSDGPSNSCPSSPGCSNIQGDTIESVHKNSAQETHEDCSQSSIAVPNPSVDSQDALIPSPEPRVPHIPSPAKFLKFLKLPGSGEKLQSPNPLRLSPQLTQTSKIPCRSNNYEAFPSPRLGRKVAEDLTELDTEPLSPTEILNTDIIKQGQSEQSPGSMVIKSGIQCCTKKSHDYENIPAMAPRNSEVPSIKQSFETKNGSSHLVVGGCSSSCPPGRCIHSQGNEGSHSQINIPYIRKPVPSRKPPEPTGHLPFRERIEKLRAPDNPQPELSLEGTEDNRLVSDGSDQRPSMKRSVGVSSLRTPEPGSTESYPPRYHAQKLEAARTRQPGAHCAPGSPNGPRNQARAPPVQNKSVRSPHGSPTKLPAKSPSKATAKPFVSRPLSEELKPSIRQPSNMGEEKQRTQSNAGKKSSTCPEYVCSRNASPQGTESHPLSAALHSAIEEKVMKGIKENMLKLQEQHRSPPSDPKQRNSSGIASWFGLKKSKLPALSRRPEATRLKEEKRERAGGGSPRSREVKGESLNISMLMEKAEDLRKALQEERAYINGLSVEKARTSTVSGEQPQNPRPLTADNFMQQLLNRVDGKEAPLDGRLEVKTPLREYPRLSPENKDARPFRTPRNGMVTHVQHCEQKSLEQNREVLPPDERLSESVTPQHFAACDSLTRTLDSGIGTFPPPDYCGGTPSKSAPKLKPRLESPSVLPVGKFSAFPKVPRRARTLERDMRSMEEMFPSGQHQSVPAFHALLTEPEPTVGHRMYREGSSKDHGRTQQGKNWTFPNAKVNNSSSDCFRTRSHDLEEVPSEGDRECDVSGYPHPSLCFPGCVSSRTPSTSEVGEEGTSEAKSRDNEQGQTGLENSESLSDSLYDSLSSCGSQG
ncbi:nck-associated protein 5-like isoform X2 [Bombina bombina]|uniref:nck-associated protein 5-like isoform X2 n=1 Tax=Bombina bombina TaxID=8345 RepID=UPI00235A8AE3|nr:nck-associated protein 5-like isoform X2 [Bombina bombina]